MDITKIIRFGPLKHSAGSLQDCEGELLQMINCKSHSTQNTIQYYHPGNHKRLLALDIDNHHRVYRVTVHDWREAVCKRWDWKFLHWLMPQWFEKTSPAYMGALQKTVSDLVGAVEKEPVDKLPTAKSTRCEWIPDTDPNGADAGKRQVEFTVTRDPSSSIALTATSIEEQATAERK